MVLRGLASSNTRGHTLMFCPIHVLKLKVVVCSVSLQPICEQTKHMPVMSE
jgi:hypothetical protein